MPSSTNIGSQTVLWKYAAPLVGQSLAQGLADIIPPGVYKGLIAYSGGGNTINISQDGSTLTSGGTLFILDSTGTGAVVRINFGSGFSTSVTSPNDAVVLRYDWTASATNYAYIVNCPWGSVLSTDIVICRLRFTTGTVSAIDNGVKTLTPLSVFGMDNSTFVVTPGSGLSINIAGGQSITAAGAVTAANVVNLAVPGVGTYLVLYDTNANTFSFSSSVVPATWTTYQYVVAQVTTVSADTFVQASNIINSRFRYNFGAINAKTLAGLTLSQVITMAQTGVNAALLNSLTATQIINAASINNIPGYLVNPLTTGAITNWRTGGGSYVSTPTWDTGTPIYGGGDLLCPFTTGTKASGDYFEADMLTVQPNQVGSSWSLSLPFIIDNSATFVDGDLLLEYYDGTNTVSIGFIPTAVKGIIQTATYNFYPTSVSGTNGKFRIRALAGSTTCVGNLRVADVILSASPVLQGAVVSPIPSYTPVAVGFGTIASTFTDLTKVGNKVFGKIRFTSGTITGVTAKLSLPPALTASVDQATVVGFWEQGQTGANYKSGTVIAQPGDNNLYFSQHETSVGDNPMVPQLASSMFFTPFVIEINLVGCPVNQYAINTTFVGGNEPFCLSNSESTPNTNGVVGKTYSGYDGSLILANTGATYYDMTLQRLLLPNEVAILEFYSPTTKDWVAARDAGIGSQFVASMGGCYFYPTGATSTVYGAWIGKTALGQVRVWFAGGGVLGASAYGTGATAIGIGWNLVSAAADGFTRWRVRIGKSSGVAEIAPKIQASYFIASFTFTATSSTLLAIPSTGKEYDTNSAWNTPNISAFTCTKNGFVRVTLNLTTATNASYQVVKNGVIQKYICGGSYSATNRVTGSLKFAVNIGDYFSIVCDTGGNVATNITIQFEMD